MHLLPLLSAIVALCLTRSAVGFPQQQQQQEQEGQRQPDSRSPDESAYGLLRAGSTPSLATAAFGLKSKLDRRGQNRQDGKNNLQKSQKQNTKKSASAGRAKTPPATGRNLSSAYRTAIWIVNKNAELAQCMYAHLVDDIKAPGEDPDYMTVTAKEWNVAAKKCKHIQGWKKEVVFPDESWDMVLSMEHHPSKRPNEDPQQPLLFSMDDVQRMASTMRKGITSAFRELRMKPDVRGVGGGIGRGALFRRVGLGR